jgi:hypothetical protein
MLGSCVGKGNRLYFVGLVTLGALGIDALFVGTLAAILLQPPAARDILGLNVPFVLLITPVAGLMTLLATFVSLSQFIVALSA